jgi:hypothetical protein
MRFINIWLSQNAAHDFSVDVGEAVMAALELVGETGVIDSE